VLKLIVIVAALFYLAPRVSSRRGLWARSVLSSQLPKAFSS
jgi:hypothetical protein